MTSANGREHLIAALHADLIGPFSGERDSREVLVLPPSRWHLTGFLSPMGDREPEDATGEEELAAGSDEDKEESADQAPEAKQRKQSHADRDIVELIFFPTGGGKTEAYLGLIAFTLLLRRLRGRDRPDQGLGAAVILRYTLRLLTLDQLDRAATLMCAMDLLRQEQPELLGSVRFAVGLWVGRSATANFMKEVYPKILDFKNNRGGSPFPLADCPWCGQKLTGEGMTVRPNTQNPEEIVVACTNFRECAFAEAKNPDGLPVVFVDEQLYNELPGFVVATVDKFALMPWRGEAGKLFGRVSARDGRRFFGPMDARIPKDASRLSDGLIPPELIVQDELHLISGPLGTKGGLYETAIEALCTQEKQGKAIKPKIVASTATIRRSEYQIDSLYGRNREIFPPPGVNENETFFSEVTSTDKVSGRLYVGLAAPGRSLKGILLRAYVDLLCAAKRLYDQDPDGADHLMSLTGYFNSLRELGGMRRLVEDDVRSLAGRRSERTPYGWDLENPWFKDRTIREPLELTSRETTEKIARAKAKLKDAKGSAKLAKRDPGLGDWKTFQKEADAIEARLARHKALEDEAKQLKADLPACDGEQAAGASRQSPREDRSRRSPKGYRRAAASTDRAELRVVSAC